MRRDAFNLLPGFEFLHPYGWTGFRGRGTLPDDFPYARYKLFRIDVPAGTAVRFEPGQSREITLVPYRGKRIVQGFRGDVMGAL